MPALPAPTPTSAGRDHASPSHFDSKLAAPRIRDGFVPRPALVERLRPAVRSTVALIVAPAGYGKTTILGEVARTGGKRPFVWIEVDEADNDPVAFARCLTTALERSGAQDPDTPQTRMRASDSHAVLVARLVKALRRARPLAIAVEHLHLLTSHRSLKIVEAVASNLPPRSQLFLTSRTHPRLALTAVRADGRLTELGTDDLRMSSTEAGELLHAAGIDAPGDDIAALTERVEGWPAGLYLAALACQGDGQELASFNGADRFVCDFFDAEYLDQMDADSLSFLSGTSLLESPSGSLCDAVLRTSGSAARLARLARSNLFVTRAGSATPHVYHLHSALREALAAGMRSRDPDRCAQIARRAAGWSESHGDLAGAVEYAWAAGDRNRFARLADEAAPSLVQTGQLVPIERWMGRIETDLLEEHPAFAVCGAFVHDLRGRPTEADTWAAIADLGPLESAMPDGSASAESWIAVLGASMCRAGKDGMRRDAARALTGLAPDSPWRPVALMLLGVGQLLAGEQIAADEMLAEAQAGAASSDGCITAAVATALRSLLAAAAGRWKAADELALSARGLLEDAQLEAHPTSPMAFVASARSAVHRSDWVCARNDLARVRDHLPDQAPAWFAILVLLEAARAHAGLSERDQAAAALGRVESILAQAPDLGVLSAQAVDLQTELDRGEGHDGTFEQLTPAESRLLPFLATHRTFREIGECLAISRNTVKTQAISTYRKLGAHSRSEAVQRAAALGLIVRSGALEAGGSD